MLECGSVGVWEGGSVVNPRKHDHDSALKLITNKGNSRLPVLTTVK